MANEHKWTVEIDDQTYQVECVTQTSLYDVYVDGELAIRVPRKLRNDDSDSEYDLKIGSKRCQLVIYDGSPDLCVDGILLSLMINCFSKKCLCAARWEASSLLRQRLPSSCWVIGKHLMCGAKMRLWLLSLCSIR